MNKKIIISIIIFLLLVGVAVFWVVKEAKERKEQQIIQQQYQERQSEEIDTSDWQTYRDEEYGFEVKYPKDWVYEKEKAKGIDKEDGKYGRVDFEDGRCSTEKDWRKRPESCDYIVRIEYFNPSTFPESREDILQNNYDWYFNKCNIGEIPFLDFKNELPEVVACQSFGTITSVWHNYFINTEEMDYVLVISYYEEDEKLGERKYSWTTDVEKNQFYTYENSKRFNLAIHQEILKSFKLITK